MTPEEFLKELLDTPAPTGMDMDAQRLWASYIAPFTDEQQCDAYGSTWAVLKAASPNAPTLMLDAHSDTVRIHPYQKWDRDPLSGDFDGTWIYGDMSGAIAIDIKHLEKAGAGEQAGKLPIVLTSELDSDTIRLGKNERTLSLSFATLDYGDANKLNYAVRLLRDNNDEWQFLGQAHDIVFHNLEPGEYVLQIRSTNSSGEWMNTERTVRVIVTPKFKETTVAQFLMALIVVLMLLAAFYIWRHIRRLDAKHRETLDAYLQLLNHNQQQTNREHEEYRMQLLENARVEPQNDKFIKKVVEYIDMHISNADIDIDSMAQHAAVSRSHLNHKLKQILGVTPSEMIREARIKHARMLLEDPNRSVNDVAYACGFTDPKYFSKCFKASTGMSPTKYRLTR